MNDWIFAGVVLLLLAVIVACAQLVPDGGYASAGFGLKHMPREILHTPIKHYHWRFGFRWVF